MQFRDIASGTRKVYHFAVSIAPLLISIAFVVAGIIIRDVPVTLFFGFCTIVLGWAQFVGFSGAKSDCDDSDLSYYSTGEFSYTETGFQYQGKEQEFNMEWTQIAAMFGYKVDMYSVDCICLTLFLKDNGTFTVSEETPGWYVFLGKLSAQFPEMEAQWDINIAVPAFETKLTLLYECNGLKFDEAVRVYYQV